MIKALLRFTNFAGRRWSRRGGLAALNPFTNVQWIKKLHRNPMLSFFAFTNSRTSPRLCPQKKPLQRSSFLIRVESEGFEPFVYDLFNMLNISDL